MVPKDSTDEKIGDRRSEASASDLLTLERLQILAGVAELFRDQTLVRGRRYAADGHVEAVRYEASGVRATVRGTHAYQTRWDWTDDGWMPNCTCPVAPDCKHAFALACVVLADRVSAGLPRQSWMDELLPEQPARQRTEDDPQKQQPDSAQPTPRQRNAMARLHSSPQWIERVHALAELLVDEPRFASAAFAPPLCDLAEIDDPDLRCFLLAHELHPHLGPRLPAALAPYLKRDDLDQREETRRQSALVDQIEAWVGTGRSRSARSLRLELQLEQHPRGGAMVCVSAHLTSKRLDDEPRTGTQIRQLLAEVNRNPDTLPTDQRELLNVLLEPVVSPSIRDYDDSFELTGSALLRLLLAAAETALLSWSKDLPPQLAEAAGLAAGQPARLAPGAVSIGPVLSHTSGPPLVVLESRFPDGSVLSADEHFVLRSTMGMRREPTLILAKGAFWTTRGDPPAALSQLFEDTGGFDPTPAPMRALIEPLARVFPAFRSSLRSHTRVHAVTPVVSLELSDDDWLQCRAFASSDPEWRPGQTMAAGATLFEWMPEGHWLVSADAQADTNPDGSTDTDAAAPPALTAADALRLDSQDLAASDAEPATADPQHGDAPSPPPTPTAGPIFFEEPDSARVAPLGNWLETLRSQAGKQRSSRSVAASAPAAGSGFGSEVGTGFELRLSPRTVDDFMAAWDARPRDVAWFGNAALRRLLTAPLAKAPKLRVVSSGVDWLTVSAAWQAEGAALTETELNKLRDSNARFVRLPSGWARKDEAQVHDEAAATLAELGIEVGIEEQKVSLLQLAHARPEALAALDAPEGGAETLRRVHELREQVAAFTGLRRVAVPRSIKATLRPYQRDGLDFLSYTTDLGLGVILADDMGLGKTLQALAWLSRLVNKQPGGGPSLVVCPASVVHNWEREAARFAPRLRVLSLTAGDERHHLRQQVPEHDLVLTNYALLRRDREALADIRWRAVILDEAQNIKNPDAAVSRSARSLQAEQRMALTGTPLENRALDLWSIQAFLNPGYLGNRASFSRRYDRSDAPPYARTLLAAKLRPVMIRRLKSQVAPELPPRIEEQLDCELTTGQRKLYLAELAKGRSLLDNLADAGGVGRNKISILAVLTRLRQICCHPALVGGKESLGSGKFDAFFELLEPLLAEGHKVLVFSQFVQCLKRVAGVMDTRGLPYHMLTGASRNRGQLVAAFESDPTPSAFLVSLKAGGTGLNLTAASYVVLFDPWWNPAVEAQAIDRTHRIGQDRTVIAYRLVAQGTIEERIRELQQAKASLARGVLGEEGFAKTLTRGDLDYLLADP